MQQSLPSPHSLLNSHPKSHKSQSPSDPLRSPANYHPSYRSTASPSSLSHSQPSHLHDPTSTDASILPPPPSIFCHQSLALTRANTRKGHVLGVLAGLIQAIDVVLLHSVLSSASFSIFIPLFIVAVSFTLFSFLSIHLFSVPVRCTLSPRLVVLFFLRAILGGCLSAASLYSLQKVPAGVAVTIFSTAPSIASILSAFLLKSRTSLREVVILAVNIIGVILVANPVGEGITSLPITTKGLVAAVFNAVCIASSFTVAKALGDCEGSVHPLLHTLALGLGALVVSPFLFCRETMMAFSSTPLAILLLVVAELLELVSQLLMSYAVKLTNPGKLLLMRSVNVPTVCLLGFITLGERLGLTQLFGVGVVLSSIAYIAAVARWGETKGTSGQRCTFGSLRQSILHVIFKRKVYLAYELETS